MNVTKRIWMMVLMGLLTLGGQAQVIIETPHNRTVSNTERTMYYDITAKNAGTLSATVSTDATAWLSASFSGTRLTIHVAKNSTDEAESSMFNVQTSKIFNLAGQQLSKPQKGVNIVNGKKAIVR